MRLIWAAVPLALLSGCDEGTPARPAFGSTEGSAAGVDAAGSDGGVAYAVCPPGMDASFGSIYTQMLSTSSCGTNNPSNCHSTTGSSFSTLLDYSLDASSVYAELLGADGGGFLSKNIDHPPGTDGGVSVLRVVPGDASASMLYIKLTVTSSNDPKYGSGMPLTAPGSVCPEALAAVGDWINGGAPFVPPEAGAASDAAVDADAGPGVDATVD